MPPPDDAVLPATRTLSIFIIPFLLVAVIVLFGAPGDTDRWFAWPIKPRMTPMVLGSVYLGGAWFFLRAARSRTWHTVKAGFVPVGTFASLMGVATVLHWDRFTHDHLAFWLWAGLYFTTPFLVFAVWAANRGHDAPVGPDDLLLAPVVRIAAGATAVAAAATSAWLFLAPERAAVSWPWTLSPLTARVMGAILALGIGAAGAALDGRWSTAKVMVEVQALMLVLIGIAAVRAHDDLDLSRTPGRIFVAGLAATLVGCVVLYLYMEGRAGRHAGGKVVAGQSRPAPESP